MGKKVSIAMMTTLSGEAYKGPQMPEIIQALEKKNILGKCYSIWTKSDYYTYDKDIRKRIHGSIIVKILFHISKYICMLTKKNYYVINEKIFGLFSCLKRLDGDVVLVKPRPAFVVEYLKKQGKIVVVEASENHTRYTRDAIINECKELGIPIVNNSYTNECCVEDYAKGIDVADYILCLSEFSKETYLKNGVDENKIFLTHLEIACKIRFPKININLPITFVCVANHGIIKGTYRLVQIWDKLQLENDLLIIGNIYDELKVLIAEQPHNEHIHFLGFMSHEKINGIYDSHKCVGILPSVSESYGRSVYEALSRSVPMIVTTTATCDIVEDGYTGYVVEPSNSEQLMKKINSFIQMSNTEYEMMRQRIYIKMSKKCTSVGQIYANVFEQILNENTKEVDWDKRTII